MDGLVDLADLSIGKPRIGGQLFLVGIGLVIQHLLELPKMLGSRHHIEVEAAGLEHPQKFLQGQGRKTVHQQVYRCVCHRQIIDRRHSKLYVLFPLGRPPQGVLG